MPCTLTSKGQVTIPKRIRDQLELVPGSRVEFAVDERGRIVIRKFGGPEIPGSGGVDRFDRARGRATVEWKTDELMDLLRGGS